VEIKWIRFAQSIFEMADKRSGRKSEKKGKSPVNPNQQILPPLAESRRMENAENLNELERNDAR
jgi:hypothetical protein